MTAEDDNAWTAATVRFADRIWPHTGIRGWERAPVVLLHLSATQDSRDAALMAHYVKSLYRLPASIRNALLVEVIG